MLLMAKDYCLNAKLRTQALSKHLLSLVGIYIDKIWRRQALIDGEIKLPRSYMSQNRGFTRGFAAIERFSILRIYSKKIRTKQLCRNSEVVAIGRLHCI